MLQGELAEILDEKPLPEQSPAKVLHVERARTRAISEAVAEPERLAVARAFGYRLIAAWWQKLTASDALPLRPPLQAFEVADLPPSVEAIAEKLGEAAAEIKVEEAAYHIGLTYTGMLPRKYRAELGVYYTPPALTARLIAQATNAGLDWTRCRVLDPACGGGAFLGPVAQRILDELPHCSPRILIENVANRLRGYEIDPFAAWLSQITLDAVFLPVTRLAGRRLPVVVTICDSLRKDVSEDRFDLVIGNPPYGRVRLDAADRARFKRSLYGHANLYGLFTDMALRHVVPGGVIAYVTPTSFLAGEYFKNLRALLRRDAPPAAIDFIKTRKGVFDDVLQETLLATYRRGSAAIPVTIHEVMPINGTHLTTGVVGSISLPEKLSQPWILPRSPQQRSLIATLSGLTHRLANWGYKVSTGPLVWNRHKGQLVAGPGRNRHPLIWAEAVTSDGQFIWRAEKKNHLPYFEIRENDDWLVTRNQCVLLQRTTAKEQARRLIAAALPKEFLDRHGAVVIENHLNMLRPIVEHPPIGADVLAAFLNSAAADRAFRCLSGSVAVSAYELEALPLPAPEKLDELDKLVRRRAGKEEVEAACVQLYDGIA